MQSEKNYEFNQIERIIKPDTIIYRVVFMNDQIKTKTLNLTTKQLKAIQNILSNK